MQEKIPRVGMSRGKVEQARIEPCMMMHESQGGTGGEYVHTLPQRDGGKC